MHPTQPPALTAITPASVNNPTPGIITIDGSNLDGIDRVTVGGVDFTNFTVISANQVRLGLPSPFLVGTLNVTASNVVGTSNALPLTVNPVHPMVLTAPGFSARGFRTDISGIGDAGWITVLFASTSSVPSNLPGFVSLSLGNNFAELLQLAVLGNDARGAWTIGLTIPTSVPPGLGLYFQAITINPLNPVPPIEASNRGQTVFF
jgi:hypothetical protein